MRRDLLLGLLLLAITPSAYCAAAWVQGSNYFLIQPAQATSVAPGKIEVTEVFSYACPACNRFYPVVDRLRTALPANAELNFVAAAFRADEDWPMFQRAYYTAQSMDIDKKSHDAMFDAVWKTGELAVFDPRTQRIKLPAPGIEDAARFYARVAGVKPETFVANAGSFGVDVKIRQADQLIRAATRPGTRAEPNRTANVGALSAASALGGLRSPVPPGISPARSADRRRRLSPA